RGQRNGSPRQRQHVAEMKPVDAADATGERDAVRVIAIRCAVPAHNLRHGLYAPQYSRGTRLTRNDEIVVRELALQVTAGGVHDEPGAAVGVEPLGVFVQAFHPAPNWRSRKVEEDSVFELHAHQAARGITIGRCATKSRLAANPSKTHVNGNVTENENMRKMRARA